MNHVLEQLKILHIGGILPHRPAGITTSILELAKAQAKLGHQVGILPSNPMNISEALLKLFDPKISLITPPSKRHRNPWWISPVWIQKIEDEFGTPEIVHFHSGYTPFQSALAHKMYQEGWPYLFSPRGIYMKKAQHVKRLKKTMGNHLFMKRFIQHASKLIMLCENERQEFSYAGEQCIIPNGIPDEFFDMLEKRKTSDHLPRTPKKAEIVIGFVGRIDVYIKGIDLLFLAIERLQRKGEGQQLTFIIVGPYASRQDEQHVQALLQQIPFKDNIILRGALSGEQKWQDMYKFDMLIHPSRTEGMPNAVLEAMAFGIPCLVSRGSNMFEIVVENFCGWGCENTVESIAGTIHQIMTYERNKLLPYGLNAKDYVKKFHAMSYIAGRHIEEYREVLTTNDHYRGKSH